MVQKVVPSNGNLLWHLNISHEGVTWESADQQDKI